MCLSFFALKSYVEDAMSKPQLNNLTNTSCKNVLLSFLVLTIINHYLKRGHLNFNEVNKNYYIEDEDES